MGKKISMYGEKIRTIRTLRGFSQDYMAEQLGVAQNTYSKYENNGDKLPFETLQKIATVLGVSITDLTSNTPIIINNQSANQGTQGIGHVENLITGQKELFERIIASKDEELNILKEVISSLKAAVDSLSKK